MAALPRFTFPLPKENNEFGQSLPIDIPAKRDSSLPCPKIRTISTEDYTLLVTNQNYSRPRPIRHLSTPPASPTRLESSAMGMHAKPSDGSLTPPPTPTGTSHVKSGSASSDYLNSLSGLRRGDSVKSRSTSQRTVDKPGSTEIITFPYQSIDYEFRTDPKGRKKTIGEGAWSDVYLATPCLLKTFEQSSLDVPMTGMSPPLTPVHSRAPSLGSDNAPTIPPLYAIKVPAMTSAKKVLVAEAKILSYLSRFTNAQDHIVPFYGLDTRTGALVLKVMDGTLESWIANELNSLSESLRAKKLAQAFPLLALSLIHSLEWMQDKDCIQADIKPSNILIDSPVSSTPKAVYTDFSSAIITKPSASIDSAASPLGAGTWDYLDPTLLRSSDPAPLSTSTDLWSLAITLLYLVIGRSPYDAFKANKYQQRGMITSGSPLQCLGYDDVGIVNMKRIAALSKGLGFDVQAWFQMVLVREPARRAGLKEWCEALGDGLAAGKKGV